MPTFGTILREAKSTLRNLAKDNQSVLIEIGPKLNIITAYSTNAVSVLKSVGLGKKINRLERSTLYLINSKVNNLKIVVKIIIMCKLIVPMKSF